jgi:hypothetical protein
MAVTRKNRGKKSQRRKTKTPRVSFDNRVLAVVNKTQETKKAVYESGLVSFNSQINSAGDVLRILPQIAHGNNSWQRSGQTIRLMKVVIKGYYKLNASESASSDARLNIRHMFLRNKRKEQWNDNGVNDLLQLLEAPNGVASQFDGTATKYMSPINREYFTSRGDKKVPMMTNQYFNSSGAVQMNSASVKFFSKTITFGKNGKEIHFEGSNESINFPYFHSMGYIHADGTAPDLVDTRLGMYYTSTAYYKDA